MTTATLPCPIVAETSAAARFDILRGVGLAVSVAVILVVPAALAVLAIING